MTTNRTVEERFSAAFGTSIPANDRASLDNRIAALLEHAPMKRRRFRLRVTRSLLLVGALLVLLPMIFVAGAAVFETEAPFGMGSADEYDAELAAAKAVTPIPPGATWPAYLDAAEDRTGSYGTGLGEQMVEMNAYCLWLGHWYEAQAAGDDAAVAEALRVLAEARTWETFTNELSSDHGFRDNVQSRIDAAEGADPETVLFELETNCTGTWRSGDED